MRARRPDASRHYIEARLHGIEVARVELDETVDPSQYVGVPPLGGQALEIQLIEVARSHRRRGIATELVGHISLLHSGRRLVAFSRGADEFWTALGWRRYDHPEGPAYYRPLFVRPV
jgi:GNAT superfamily N-acetyltransferase